MISVPSFPKAITLPEPELAPFYQPNTLVITPKEVQFYQDICDDYADLNGNQDQEQALYTETGLSKSAACDWAIYGFTVQDWLTFESHLVDIARYIEELKAQNRYLRQVLKDRQQLMEQHKAELMKLNRNDEADP